MKTGIELIAEERTRQILDEGYTALHDDDHDEGELASAAACYAMADVARENTGNSGPPMIWPWDADYWRPSPSNRIHELIKAGALIAAEIDRLNRLEAKGA